MHGAYQATVVAADFTEEPDTTSPRIEEAGKRPGAGINGPLVSGGFALPL